MIEKLYEEELRYLHESGRQFAQAHPDQARFLNIDAVGDRDPYVERLFEGFAFLSARIREKLDDSFPELSEGIVDLLWPHLQQEIPSLAMVEFRPRSGGLAETRVLARGTELLSRAVGPDNVICTFSTTADVALNPLALAAVEARHDTKRKASLVLRFAFQQGITWSKIRLDPLRLYVHAEMPVALMLHEMLTRHVTGAVITADDGDGQTVTLEGASAATPGGMTPAEALLPADPRSFPEFTRLLEYFVYPEKFLFVDLHGLDSACFRQRTIAPEQMTITISFDRGFPPDRPFGAENLRLFCAPAVNLFLKTTEPVPTKITDDEYRICADNNAPTSFAAHSIVSVIGIDRASGVRRRYEPLHSFKALGPSGRTYAVRYCRGPDGVRAPLVVLGGRGEDGGAAEENLSLEAYFTNGALPRNELREGDIAFPGASFPSSISFVNITRPSLPCAPPPDDQRWTFLAHLGATYSSLATAESLKRFLALYDWSGSEGRRRRIEAVEEVTAKPAETLLEGSVVRGVEFTIAMEESAFSDVNDLHLFGQVLAAFFARYVSINAFFSLVITGRPSGRTLRWESLRGAQWPI